MYAKYVSNTISNQTEILNDVTAILTGTTDANSLSASCDKVSTSILTTVAPAGWTLHDADANGSGTIKVIKAPVYDNANKFKYVRLDSTSAGYILFTSGETWNSTTNTGTNFSIFDGNGFIGERISTTLPTTIFISASSRYLFIMTNYSGTWGSSYGSAPTYVFEYTRWSSWDTSTNEFPNWVNFVCANNGNNSSLGRYRDANGNIVAANQSVGHLNTILGSPSISKTSSPAGVVTIPMVPIICSVPSVGHFGGNVTEQCGIYMCPGNLSVTPFGDEIVLNGTTYVYCTSASIGTNTTSGFLFPKG